jgi:glycosyltransferase involved in cell wall biosynthesis
MSPVRIHPPVGIVTPVPDGSTKAPLVACLLPVRNGAEHLPEWFETVRPVADTVIALDDGSTDGTWALLTRSDLVSVVLRHPRRDTYAGWDDSANRNELLTAAADVSPRWIVQLDADERLDPDDALALRRFLDEEAEIGCGYSFQAVQMVEDRHHCRPTDVWMPRVFAYAPGQRFPSKPLHFRQLPTSIAAARVRRTTIRIQHLGGMSEALRRERVSKYREADPQGVHHPGYDRLLRPPPDVQAWETRPPGLPVVYHGPGRPPPVASPALTAVVIAREDAGTIVSSLTAIASQRTEVDLEIVAVISGSATTAQAARSVLPATDVLEHSEILRPGAARNLGLARAHGTAVSFPGSHAKVDPGALAARLAAHQRGYAMVTGTIRNGTDTPAGWASYFLESSQSLPGLPAAELQGPPISCSYLRSALEWAGGFPDWRSAEDTAVNQRLFARGYGAYRDPAMSLVHRTPCVTVALFLRHQRVRGRGWGGLMATEDSAGRLRTKAGVYQWGVAMMPVSRTVYAARHVWRCGDRSLQRRFVSVVPLVFIGALVGWVQAWATFGRSQRRLARVRAPQRS